MPSLRKAPEKLVGPWMEQRMKNTESQLRDWKVTEISSDVRYTRQTPQW